jgi:hypothetical protein
MPVLDQAELSRAFTGFETDVKQAVAQGTHIFIIAPMPIGSTDYPKELLAEITAAELPLPLARPLPFDSSARSFSYDDGPQSPPEVLRQLLFGIAQRTGATLIEPDHYLCPAGHCPYCDQSHASIYKDAVHLRGAYIRSNSMQWLDQMLGIKG